MFCSKCGTNADEAASFCGRCGAPLSTRRPRRSRRVVVSVLAVVLIGALVVTGWAESWPPSLFGRTAPSPGASAANYRTVARSVLTEERAAVPAEAAQISDLQRLVSTLQSGSVPASAPTGTGTSAPLAGLSLSSPTVESLMGDVRRIVAALNRAASPIQVGQAASAVVRAAPDAASVLRHRVGSSLGLLALFRSTGRIVATEAGDLRRSQAGPTARTSFAPGAPAEAVTAGEVRSARDDRTVAAGPSTGSLLGELSSDANGIDHAMASETSTLVSEANSTGSALVDDAASGLNDATTGVVQSGEQAISAVTSAASATGTWFVKNSKPIATAADAVAQACDAVAITGTLLAWTGVGAVVAGAAAGCAVAANGVAAVADALNPNLPEGQKLLDVSLNATSALVPVAADYLATGATLATAGGTVTTADGIVGWSSEATTPGLLSADAELIKIETEAIHGVVSLAATPSVQQGLSSIVSDVQSGIAGSELSLGSLAGSFDGVSGAVSALGSTLGKLGTVPTATASPPNGSGQSALSQWVGTWSGTITEPGSAGPNPYNFKASLTNSSSGVLGSYSEQNSLCSGTLTYDSATGTTLELTESVTTQTPPGTSWECLGGPVVLTMQSPGVATYSWTSGKATGTIRRTGSSTTTPTSVPPGQSLADAPTCTDNWTEGPCDGSVAYTQSVDLSGSISVSGNVTIQPGVTLTTGNDDAVLVGGTFTNDGVVSGGYGVLPITTVLTFPESYGGSGGGEAWSPPACSGGAAGGATLGAGGASGGGDGSTPPAPTSLSASLLDQWLSTGVGTFLDGGGSGGDDGNGGYGKAPNAYGVYIQANTLVAGMINVSGRVPELSEGGSGGGAILLAYGPGGLTDGSYDVAGGTGNVNAGCHGGRGGDGRVITFDYGATPPALPT